MDPLQHHFGEKPPKTPFFDIYSPMICDSESFPKSCLAQTMCPIALCNDAKIGQILEAVLKKKQKNLEIRTLNPY